ncbi:3-dehydroquinate synthase [Flagellimonas eckloniae]|uniref:3-dehydroquinate synthase n=1 Tax=Flagellimonas eckloniae TaxID=346185 RepID=A0A0Q0XKG6_9FLAO|nr:3-dehydroquinate synthase [Allomuricauda eckloniae]KQC29422.1 3-dehydroquinate synthase [Allomuricauda eckloniae]
MKSLPPISQAFSVKYEYKLHFTEHLFALDNELFLNIIKDYKDGESTKIIFIIDDEVANAHPKIVEEIESYCSQNVSEIQLMQILVVKGGEASKNNYSNVKKIVAGINDNAICRHSFVAAIGGGALIDMVGYAAAIAHRGVKLIRIPTTVLSQNDAAVGVKNGINEFDKKNFLGTFAPPFAIINDFNFLKTLDQRDWISGIAEAIKVALIKDEVFFEYIKKHTKALANREKEPMAHVIYKCAEMHMQHIAQGGDPFESGSSRPLDFGHWAAHKLEQITNYDLRHGEAVAMGIALDVTYAQMIGLISMDTLNTILNVLEEIGFDLKIPINNHSKVEELLKGIQEFREHLGGELTITLISKIGVKHDVHTIDMEKMRASIALRSIGKEELSC